MPSFFVLATRTDQLIVGGFNLVLWLVLMPFAGAAMLRVVRSMNEAVFGTLAPWHDAAFRFGHAFLAAACFFFALYATALLSVSALTAAGLIKNPWE